jgi:MazG family protein
LSLEQALADLQQLTVRLRSECEWDREQTAATIVPHTVEEAYEVADAALAGDDAKLLDELGDLLYQVYFLALLLSERAAGDLEQVARGVHAKLVRRHPHVFGEAPSPAGAGRVKRRWEELKTEQEGREGTFHDLPDVLPALLYARKVLRRAATAGYVYPDVDGPLGHLEEEVKELKGAIASHGQPREETAPDPALMDELGDVLFTAVAVAAQLNVDPELALRQTSRKFIARVECAATFAAERGERWTALTLDAQRRYYEEAKEALR